MKEKMKGIQKMETDRGVIVTVQISSIFKHMSKELIDKIPAEIINKYKSISDNSKYEWIYDESKMLTNQDLHNGTRQLLYKLIIKYMLDENEKKDANEYRRKFQIQLENEKRAKYNPDNIFKNNEKKLDVKAEEVALVEYNEYKWYKKIIMKIKNLFKRK